MSNSFLLSIRLNRYPDIQSGQGVSLYLAMMWGSHGGPLTCSHTAHAYEEQKVCLWGSQSAVILVLLKCCGTLQHVGRCHTDTLMLHERDLRCEMIAGAVTQPPIKNSPHKHNNNHNGAELITLRIKYKLAESFESTSSNRGVCTTSLEKRWDIHEKKVYTAGER